MLAWLGRSALILLAFGGMGCSGTDDLTPAARRNGYCRDETPGLIAAAGDPSDPVEPISEEPVADSECNAVERAYPIADSSHVTLCSPVEYGTNPPSSGHHYPRFPRYAIYEYAIPRGFWVHSLEHGAVVITYSCTDCTAEIINAEAVVRSIAPAPICSSSASNQIVMTPDPGIPTRWAASSWGFTLTADCFEPAIFENFVISHRDNGSPELVCDNTYATDVTRPGSD